MALARAASQAFALPPEQADRVLQAPGACCRRALADFFNPAALRWTGNEVPLAVDGACLRIDRLVQLKADGCWWVLDYKLNSVPQALASNREQLRRYRAAVAALQPGETVRAAFVAGGGRFVPLEDADT